MKRSTPRRHTFERGRQLCHMDGEAQLALYIALAGNFGHAGAVAHACMSAEHGGGDIPHQMGSR